MRYFRYQNTNKSRINALKEQYKTLTENEKRTFRREKRWRTFGTFITLVVYFSCMVICALLLKAIPEPDPSLLRFLVWTCKVLLGFVALIVSGVLTAALTMPLWKKVESFHIPSMKKEIFSKACGHLRQYYGLQEPYIVTKCFDATDQKFRNHDVCIFVVDDELRITTDLVRGFLHGERDLGCCAFKRGEITLSKQKNGDQLVAEVRAGNTVFLLGYRAKRFIDRNFLAKAFP